MLRVAFIAAVLALALAGCLRPRYVDLVGELPKAKDAPKELKLQVVDSSSGDPVPGAKVELGERARFKATADAQGIFSLPVDMKYLDENALVVVNLPKGVLGYRLIAIDGPGGLGAPPRSDAADAGVTSM